jgi:hypothetical protein
LIVAAGGLPTADAVGWAINDAIQNNKAPPPFVFLIGRYPQTASDAMDLYNCPRNYNDPMHPGVLKAAKAGGVDMNMVAQNRANIQKLMPHIGSGGTVGLIVNHNNPITPAEISDFANITGINPTTSPFIYQITDSNTDAQAIRNLLSKISANPADGIVVSSDPFLREVGNADFDKQLRDPTATNFQGWVIYPFQEYVLDSSSNGKTIHSDATPALGDSTNTNSGYYQLGVIAGNTLTQIVYPTATSPPNAGLITWNGTGWGLPDYSFP